MICDSFQHHHHSMMSDFLDIPGRLYKDDPWYIPVPNSKQIWQFNHDQNPFYQYGTSRQFIVYRSRLPLARCAAARNPMMDKDGEKIGTIGFFESVNDQHAVRSILGEAMDWLTQQGVTRVYGPMNFSIWSGYRFRTSGFDYAPYLTDIYNKPYYARLFTDAGFQLAGKWISAEVDLESQADAYQRKMDKLEKRLVTAGQAGYEIAFHKGSYRGILDEIQDLVMECYSNFLGFYPISRKEFRAIFQSLKRLLRPGQLLTARRDGELMGFLIQYWDWAHLLRSCKRGPNIMSALQMRYGPVPKKWIMSIGGVRRVAMTDHSGLASGVMHLAMGHLRKQGASSVIYSLNSEHNRSRCYWTGIPARCTDYALYKIDI